MKRQPSSGMLIDGGYGGLLFIGFVYTGLPHTWGQMQPLVSLILVEEYTNVHRNIKSALKRLKIGKFELFRRCSQMSLEMLFLVLFFALSLALSRSCSLVLLFILSLKYLFGNSLDKTTFALF